MTHRVKTTVLDYFSFLGKLNVTKDFRAFLLNNICHLRGSKTLNSKQRLQKLYIPVALKALRPPFKNSGVWCALTGLSKIAGQQTLRERFIVDNNPTQYNAIWRGVEAAWEESQPCGAALCLHLH